MRPDAPFVAAILANPRDETVRLVYADWLDEQGDARGGLLRTHLIALLREERSLSFRADRSVFCPLLATEISVSVYTDGAEVQNTQVAAFAKFVDIPPGQRSALLEPLYANYRACLEAFGEGPEIAGPEQVWSFVRWTDVIVPLQGPGRNRFVLVQGDPLWEEEHGVEMLFRDEELICVDQASGACTSACFWNSTAPWDRS
ncbi:MAG: TIGR02996 domain-containing protein [Gemmataceae bacterium]